jgi:2-amino-4-hydroxy-6-hydroxymethyldihydropteridine diphosphokinase
VHTALLSLGSNLDPQRHLRAAAQALRERFGEVVFSDVLHSPAAGFEGPDFLNAAAMIRTDLDAHGLDDWLHVLEAAQGRVRGAQRFTSRTLDIDIVFYDDLILAPAADSQLRIPRPDIEHAFVLQPLAQIAPDFRDPLSGCTLAQLWVAHPGHARPLPVASEMGVL